MDTVFAYFLKTTNTFEYPKPMAVPDIPGHT